MDALFALWWLHSYVSTAEMSGWVPSSWLNRLISMMTLERFHLNYTLRYYYNLILYLFSSLSPTLFYFLFPYYVSLLSPFNTYLYHNNNIHFIICAITRQCHHHYRGEWQFNICNHLSSSLACVQSCHSLSSQLHSRWEPLLPRIWCIHCYCRIWCVLQCRSLTSHRLDECSIAFPRTSTLAIMCCLKFWECSSQWSLVWVFFIPMLFFLFMDFSTSTKPLTLNAPCSLHSSSMVRSWNVIFPTSRPSFAVNARCNMLFLFACYSTRLQTAVQMANFYFIQSS